ncbi:interleukin-15-like isoform X1 [Thunnus albacares]|uniref:interleukin-15-like isoform X1 n=1 Tax=Thunnus albacares TaxID=8236 RepID=UPI001CF6FF4E|nr:interleukin-15-like isoform X1 [Thunnus albacares]
MKDFMTALPVILVQLTCPGDQRPKGAQFQLTCNLCRESHKTQVWLCFLLLSFLSMSTCSAQGPHLRDLKHCVEEVKQTIEKSDAMLYAPSTDDIKENCRIMALKCYMLELIMVLHEEKITIDAVYHILNFNEYIKTMPGADQVGCPPCEAYSLKNITVFLARLNHLLEERIASQMAN